MKKILLFTLLLASLMPINATKAEWALKGVPTTKVFYEGSTTGGFHDGIAVVQDVESKDWETPYGAINTMGQLVIPYKYKKLSDFYKGTAYAQNMDGKYGIINTSDVVLLPFEFKEIKRVDNHPDLYMAEKSEGKFFFYEGRLLNTTAASYTSTDDFPFIRIDDYHLNIYTGQIIKSAYKVYGYYSGNNEYYQSDGTPIDAEKGKISSKGISWFKDETSKLFGLKNEATGAIVFPAKFEFMKTRVWTHNVLVASSCKNEDKDCIINTDGTIVEMPGEVLYLTDYGIVFLIEDKYGLCDYNGKIILPLENSFIIPKPIFGEAVFIGCKDGQQYLFNAKTNKRIEGFFDETKINEGIGISWKDGNSYYVDLATFDVIAGPYKYAYKFSEGLAKVDDNKFINRKGKVVADFSQFDSSSIGNFFSEGVIPVVYRDENFNRIYGFIYNPLGNSKYVYNQKGATKSVINSWAVEADALLKDKKYGKAKDVYYRVMVADPQNINAVINYGYCLDRLGFQEEALEAFSIALDIDPNNELAKKNYAVVKQYLEQNRQNQVSAERNNGGFWNSLMNFTNVLTQTLGGQGSNTIGGYGDSYGSYDSYDSGSSNTSGASEATLRSIYQKWEARAKDAYDSLTLMGTKVTSKKGDKSGSGGGFWKGSNYVGLKQNLRDAQRQMRHIRSEASSKGFNIPQSKWETATVSY